MFRLVISVCSGVFGFFFGGGICFLSILNNGFRLVLLGIWLLGGVVVFVILVCLDVYSVGRFSVCLVVVVVLLLRLDVIFSNRLWLVFMILVMWVLGWFVLLIIRIIGKWVVSVLCRINCVCGNGFLEVLISSSILFIMDSLCFILLLKFVCFGVFMILIMVMVLFG